jgi:hypothetical protein
MRIARRDLDCATPTVLPHATKGAACGTPLDIARKLNEHLINVKAPTPPTTIGDAFAAGAQPPSRHGRTGPSADIGRGEAGWAQARRETAAASRERRHLIGRWRNA